MQQGVDKLLQVCTPFLVFLLCFKTLKHSFQKPAHTNTGNLFISQSVTTLLTNQNCTKKSFGEYVTKLTKTSKQYVYKLENFLTILKLWSFVCDPKRKDFLAQWQFQVKQEGLLDNKVPIYGLIRLPQSLSRKEELAAIDMASWFNSVSNKKYIYD